jgi:hypothetical protein
MFIGLIVSIVIGIFLFKTRIFNFLYKTTGVIDAGGLSKVYETVKNGNRLQLSVYEYLI